MTNVSQNIEFEILGSKIAYQATKDEKEVADKVVSVVLKEIEDIKRKRPQSKDTDIAVLIALKMATEKFKLEEDFKSSILSLEEKILAVLKS